MKMREEIERSDTALPELIDHVREYKAAYAETNLPSRGVPYSNAGKISIRPLDVVETQMIRSILDGSGRSVVDALKNVTKPIPVSDLTLGDFSFVCAWLRVNTFPHVPLSFTWKCAFCDSENQFDVDLTKLKLVELPSDFKEPFVLTLPDCGEELPLRLPRAGDSLIVDKYINAVYPDGNEKEEWLAEMAMTVANGEKMQSNIDLLRTLSSEDLSFIDQVPSALPHGLPEFLTDTCKGTYSGLIAKNAGKKEGEPCGVVNERLRFEFRLRNILPLSDIRRVVRDAIRFGLPPEHSDSAA